MGPRLPWCFRHFRQSRACFRVWGGVRTSLLPPPLHRRSRWLQGAGGRSAWGGGAWEKHRLASGFNVVPAVPDMRKPHLGHPPAFEWTACSCDAGEVLVCSRLRCGFSPPCLVFVSCRRCFRCCSNQAPVPHVFTLMAAGRGSPKPNP